MVAISDEATNTLVPFELDQITKEYISPEKLPYYSGPSSLAEIDQAYELLDKSQTSEEFYKAIAILVFHARHLSPVEHAHIAEIISKPFKRLRGGQVNAELRDLVEELALILKFISKSKISTPKQRRKERAVGAANLAKRLKTSKKIVNRALIQAEKGLKPKKEPTPE